MLIAAQTISLPRPIVNVWHRNQHVFSSRTLGGGVKAHHSVTLVLRIGLDDAVCGGVVASSIHGIRSGFVEGGLFQSYQWSVYKTDSEMTPLTGNLTSRVRKPVILTIVYVAFSL